MRLINIKKLQIGMILGESIYRNDQLVISKGITLNSRHISMIKYIGLDKIKIKFDIPIKKDSKIINLNLEEKYQNSIKKFKEICFSTVIGNIPIYDQVEDCIDILFEEISNNPKMAVKLWQIEMTDYYTYEHSVRVSMLAVLLSKWLSKSDDTVLEIAKTALLHDIGKCNIPNEILNKPDMLTPEEFSVMKTHSTLGYILLSVTKEFNSNVLEGVLQHHEKYDGTGYPGEISGENIHEYARIISIVDIFDAMLSNRIYRNKMNPYKVIEIIHNGNQGALDLKMIKVFIENIKHYFIGMKVLLNNGEIAEIISADSEFSYRPIIKLKDEIINLSENFNFEIQELILE